MSEELIIKKIANWLDNRKFPFQVPRAFIYDWESDFWCMTSDGETREFEIKISRSDYLIDKKKQKHVDVSKGANYFYYVCPKGLISVDEVPKNYGLITFEEHRFDLIKKPRRLNYNAFTNWKMLAHKMYWKWYSVWWQKYKDKEISVDEWREGFNLDLQAEELL